MRNTLRVTAILIAGFLPYVSLGEGEIRATIIPSSPFQGDTAIVAFSDKNLEPTGATFDGAPVPFFLYRGTARAVVGIAASKPPGTYLLRAEFTNGAVFEKRIAVRARRFQKIVLGIPKKLGLTPQGLVTQIQKQNVDLQNIVKARTPQIFFDSLFGLPLFDNRKVTSPFGEIRKTGDQEIRHVGVDFKAARGAAVGAVNGGVVRKTGFDAVYGNVVVLDHGEGIYSLYLHLNEIRVKEGERVRKGTVVGTVGETGYSTEPHLHLSIKVGTVSVDPLRFVERFR